MDKINKLICPDKNKPSQTNDNNKNKQNITTVGEDKASNKIHSEKNESKIVEILNKYKENGMKGLENKRKPGNPMAKIYSKKKFDSREEKLEYENMKLRIENERLKKGYLVKGDGSVVVFKK